MLHVQMTYKSGPNESWLAIDTAGTCCCHSDHRRHAQAKGMMSRQQLGATPQKTAIEQNPNTNIDVYIGADCFMISYPTWLFT